MSKEDLLTKFSALSATNLPDKLVELDESQLEGVNELIDSVLERERAGLDSMFSAMTHTMKFIPNLILVNLTPRYIEPSIAARICAELTVKQAVAIANGLKPEYVAESSRYMEPELAVTLLVNMKESKAKNSLALICAHEEDVVSERLINAFPESDRKRLLD